MAADGLWLVAKAGKLRPRLSSQESPVSHINFLDFMVVFRKKIGATTGVAP